MVRRGVTTFLLGVLCWIALGVYIFQHPHGHISVSFMALTTVAIFGPMLIGFWLIIQSDKKE
jgi:hypothetical protein